MAYENTAALAKPEQHVASMMSIALLDASEEAAAVVAGYRALQADRELQRCAPGSTERAARTIAVLGPVAEAWGVSTRDLLQAVGRGID